MKTKNFYSIGAMAIAIIAVMFSCQQDDSLTNKTAHSKFLSIEHDIVYEQLTPSELNTLGLAFVRFDFKKNDEGKLVMKQKAGSEVGVSENIFVYFQKLLNQSNMGKIFVKNKATRVYEDSISESGDGRPSGDCVIYSILAQLRDMDRLYGRTYSSIKSELEELGLYRDGVLLSDMTAALNQYFSINDSMSVNNFNVDAGKHVIVAIRIKKPDGTYDYHSCSVICATNGVFLCRDDQNGGFCVPNREDVVGVWGLE